MSMFQRFSTSAVEFGRGAGEKVIMINEQL